MAVHEFGKGSCKIVMIPAGNSRSESVESCIFAF